MIILSLLGIGLFIGSPIVATLFTKDPEALRQIVVALRIDAFNQPGLAISLILAGVLQGMGDTKTPLYSTAFGMWVIRIVGVIVLGNSLNLGIAGVWLAIGIDLYTRSAFCPIVLKEISADLRKRKPRLRTSFSLRTGRNILAQTKAPKQEGGNTKWQA